MLKIIYIQTGLLFIMPIASALRYDEIGFLNEFTYLPMTTFMFALLQTFRYNNKILIRIKYFIPIGLVGFYGLNVFILNIDLILGTIAIAVAIFQMPLYQEEMRRLAKGER